MKPKWLDKSIIYQTVVGSHAYGVNTTGSDIDKMGICILQAEYIYPEKYAGLIYGFDKIPKFEQYQAKLDNEDITTFNIVKFFKLALDNNPNIIESLYTDEKYITCSTEFSNYIRANRHLFLHQECINKFIGYAKSQLSKMTRNRIGNRTKIVEKYGYDIKSAYHTIRLLLYLQHILLYNTIPVGEYATELLSIKNGNYDLGYINNKAELLFNRIEIARNKTLLQKSPDKYLIKTILIDCLDGYYGDYN